LTNPFPCQEKNNPFISKRVTEAGGAQEKPRLYIGFAKNLFRTLKHICHAERSEASRFLRFFGRFASSE
jgi:hypothetical protein